MGSEKGGSSWHPSSLDEDAHFFDFVAFYKKVEFCDRSIRLEILEESRKVHGAHKDADTKMAEVRPETPPEAGPSTAGTSGATTSGESGETPGEAAGEVEKETRESEKGSSESEGVRILVQKELPEEGEGSERLGKDSVNGQADSKEHMEKSDSPGDTTGESAKPIGDAEGAPGGLESAPGGEAPGDLGKGPSDMEMASGDSEEEPGESGLPAEEEEWVEEIPVNSIVLAAKSCVLRTMLSNGMKESDKREPVILKVSIEEREAFKEMLHFMYAGSLSAHFQQPDAGVRALMDLLIVGDKFEVGSFMGAVLKALSKRERTVSDSVVLALGIPDVLQQHVQIKKVVEEARAHLVETFKDVEKWGESLEFLTLGHDVVQFLLQSEELEAASEEEVFLNVLVWVNNNFDGKADRQRAMSALSGYIRFGCMRGEFLVESVLPLSEMALAECQERVKHGIYFQAFSDHKKQKVTDVSCTERKGICAARLEIVGLFRLDEKGTTLKSGVGAWLGREWYFKLQKDSRSDPPTVGIFFTRGTAKNEEVKEEIHKVSYTFYALTWPNGFWKRLFQSRGTPVAYEKEVDGRGFGCLDAFDLSWDEARKSAEFVGCTGEISVKVVALLRAIESKDVPTT